MSDLTNSWSNVTEGNAPLKLMNHVGAIDANAEVEVEKIQRLNMLLMSTYTTFS
jgi:hypothetical protein